GPLFAKALKDADAGVRLAALFALEPAGRNSEAVVGQLATALTDADRNVRIAAVAVLGRIGPPAKSALPALPAAPQDADAGVRISVADVLAGLEPARAAMVLPIVSSGLTDKDPQVRRAAAYVLGQLGNGAKDAIPALTAALKDESAEVRQA